MLHNLFKYSICDGDDEDDEEDNDDDHDATNKQNTNLVFYKYV